MGCARTHRGRGASPLGIPSTARAATGGVLMIEQKDKLVATRATRIVIALTAVTCLGAVVAAAPVGLTSAVQAAKPKIERTGFRPLAEGPVLQVGKQFGSD